MARSLFRDIKRSCCLVCLRPSMSLGRRRGYSKALARKVAYPLWDSQIVASQGMGAPPNSSRGAHVRDPQLISAPVSSLLSTEGARLSLTFLSYFAPFRGMISPSSPSCAFLFFFKLGQGSNPSVVIGGRVKGTWVLGTSFDINPMF